METKTFELPEFERMLDQAFRAIEDDIFYAIIYTGRYGIGRKLVALEKLIALHFKSMFGFELPNWAIAKSEVLELSPIRCCLAELGENNNINAYLTEKLLRNSRRKLYKDVVYFNFKSEMEYLPPLEVILHNK